jgi:hypothetical protein
LHLIADVERFTLPAFAEKTVGRVKQLVAERFDTGEDSVVLRQRARILPAETRLGDIREINSTAIYVRIEAGVPPQGPDRRSTNEDEAPAGDSMDQS